MLRRRFVLTLGGAVAASISPRCSVRAADSDSPLLFYVSAGKTAMIRADGSGQRELRFDVPSQATWQPGPAFRDGRRTVLLSMEPRRDGPGKSFDEYYTQTPTHLWIYDLEGDRLTEICTRERRAPFYTPALLIDDRRLLVQVVRDRVGQIVSMNLDGSDARDFTRPGEGLPYGFSLSPDGQRVAFHLASPEGYQVWTSDTQGEHRTRVAAGAGHLYFGTSWSPNGEWIVYQDCHYQSDPGHDWSDICVGRPDGSEHRVLTSEQPQWFAATYGNATVRGSGSNMPAWTRDGKILFSRRLPGTRVAWQYRVGQPDLDHFNRDFRPEEARGGAQLCALDPEGGAIEALTSAEEERWDFRPTVSPDGAWIAFCRTHTGHMPTIWIMRRDGSEARELVHSEGEQGVDHPKWFGT